MTTRYQLRAIFTWLSATQQIWQFSGEQLIKRWKMIHLMTERGHQLLWHQTISKKKFLIGKGLKQQLKCKHLFSKKEHLKSLRFTIWWLCVDSGFSADNFFVFVRYRKSEEGIKINEIFLLLFMVLRKLLFSSFIWFCVASRDFFTFIDRTFPRLFVQFNITRKKRKIYGDNSEALMWFNFSFQFFCWGYAFDPKTKHMKRI